MNRCLSALIALLLLAPGLCRSEPALRLVKQIGPGWAGDFNWMSFVAFSQDGETIASDAAASPTDTSETLTLWSFPKGRLIKQLPVRPTAVSPDFRYFATFQSVGAIDSGKLLVTLPTNNWALHTFSPDSRFVAEAAQGGGVKVFELPSARQISRFGRLQPSSIAISPDGTTLASGHWNVVKLWNLRTGQRIAVLHGFRRYVDGLSFSRDGKMLATSGGGEVQIWNMRRRTNIKTVEVDAGEANPSFSPDGHLIAIGAYGTGTVWLIDAYKGRIIDHRKVSDLGCGSSVFSPDGRYLITPSTGGLITWPYDHGGSVRVFRVRAT